MSSDTDFDMLMKLVVGVLAILLVSAYGLVNCIGPCSWVSWEPLKDLPARCLPGITK
jgi:hypothetical protein